MTTTYSDPVTKLLTVGEWPEMVPHDQWHKYLNLGISQEHVQELIGLATDKQLRDGEADFAAVWGPMHALRILGVLKAEEAAEQLVRLHIRDDIDEWRSEELPIVFGMIGINTIPVLLEVLNDSKIDVKYKTGIPQCIEKMALLDNSVREQCIDVLAAELEDSKKHDPEINGFLIYSLIETKAVEKTDILRAAHDKLDVDISICGDFEEVEIALGLKEKRTTPKPRFQPEIFFGGNLGLPKSVPERRKKVGRKDPCPCGSGKKYKKCCLH